MLHRSGRGERAMDRKGRKTHSFVALFLVTGLLLASLTRASGQQERQADRNKQLVLAVASLEVEQTRQCLRDGADPNLLVELSLSLPPFQGPRLLFHYPVTRKSVNVTTLLKSILSYAGDSKARQKAPQIALLLIEAGANPNCPNDPRNHPTSRKRSRSRHLTDPEASYWSPLCVAADLHLPQVVQALLDHGAHVNPEGEAPLFHALRYKDNSIALLLLAHGANPNCRNALGFTPLMGAVGFHDVVLVRALLARGANPALKNFSGETAVDVARRFAYRDLVTLLTQPTRNRKKQSSNSAKK